MTDIHENREGRPSGPLVTHLFTADPSAHVFDGRLYVYPSHDIDAGVPEDDTGAHFAMEDYHVLSMERPGAPVTDHGVALHVRDVPWAERQMWAPDVARRGDTYLFYFPAKDSEGRFRIGVAVGDRPEGPFVPEPEPIPGTYSIDPTVLDDDGTHYLYWGGIWGGQLQKYRDDVWADSHDEPVDDEPALGPRVARLDETGTRLVEPSREVVLLGEDGHPLRAGDHDRRFFEGTWVHRHAGRYYLSWSTGNTHRIVYGVGDDPYGPFTFAGTVLEPVTGWTTQHSIVEHEGRWWLFFHDASLSGGRTPLRCVRVVELHHDEQGRIRTVDVRDDGPGRSA